IIPGWALEGRPRGRRARGYVRNCGGLFRARHAEPLPADPAGRQDRQHRPPAEEEV
ncbi:uncharacterized protein METZ01_LOCUS356699, partial [marine metagenome]